MSLNVQRGTSPVSTRKKWRSGEGHNMGRNTPAAALPASHKTIGRLRARRGTRGTRTGRGNHPREC
jgi:hypothetical protein